MERVKHIEYTEIRFKVMCRLDSREWIYKYKEKKINNIHNITSRALKICFPKLAKKYLELYKNDKWDSGISLHVYIFNEKEMVDYDIVTMPLEEVKEKGIEKAMLKIKDLYIVANMERKIYV